MKQTTDLNSSTHNIIHEISKDHNDGIQELKKNPTLTHLEAFEYVSAQEDYFLIYETEIMDRIYDMKNVLMANKKKRIFWIL